MGNRAGDICIPDGGLLLRSDKAGRPTINRRRAIVGDRQISRISARPCRHTPARRDIPGGGNQGGDKPTRNQKKKCCHLNESAKRTAILEKGGFRLPEEVIHDAHCFCCFDFLFALIVREKQINSIKLPK